MLFASGNLLHFLDIESGELKFLRTSGGITALQVHPTLVQSDHRHLRPVLLQVRLVGGEGGVAQVEERETASGSGAPDGGSSDEGDHGAPPDGLIGGQGLEVHHEGGLYRPSHTKEEL